MATYAQVTDLAARWRPLTPDEVTRAGVLLDDASVRLDAECAPPELPTAEQLELRKIVVCEMVKRAMAVPGGLGVSSVQQGAGPYQETTQFANPTGDLYLTKADRKLLGCGQQRAFTVSMAPDPPDLWPGLTGTELL